MTSDALAVVQNLFSVIWSLFTSWYIPGTHVTPGAMLVFCLFFALGIRFIKRITSVGDSND